MSDVIEIDSFAELENIVADSPVALLKFWATWCGPCKRFAPHYEAAAAKSEATFLSVDVDAVPDVALQYNVSSIPTVLLFKNGDLVGPVQGRTAVKLLSEIN